MNATEEDRPVNNVTHLIHVSPYDIEISVTVRLPAEPPVITVADMDALALLPAGIRLLDQDGDCWVKKPSAPAVVLQHVTGPYGALYGTCDSSDKGTFCFIESLLPFVIENPELLDQPAAAATQSVA